MFDLSFSEILLVLVVAFVIFGPERFPVMLRDAIEWIKKIKTLAFEAQRSLDDIGKNLKKDLPDLNTWTPSSSVAKTGSTPPVSPVKPIEIDRSPESYTKQGEPWRSTLKVDRDKSSYESQALGTLPWRKA